MKYIIGLGNPGDEYVKSRHNTGRIILESFRKQNSLPDWEIDKKSKSLISKGEVEGEKVLLILPETFMNKSGISAGYFIKSKKSAENLIVVYDDIDLALGEIKISFNKGSGGHHGLESVAKAVKTKEFARIRVGISPATPKGKIKKPDGDKKVLDFILGKFRDTEEATLKKVAKSVGQAILILISEGRERAMNQFN